MSNTLAVSQCSPIMRLPITSLLLLALRTPAKDVAAFSSNHFDRSRIGYPLGAPSSILSSSSSSSTVTTRLPSSTADDCGCAPTIFSGNPSDVAKNSNPRQAIRNGLIFSLDSKEIRMDDLLENKNVRSPVSIVVFLRSLG